MNALEEATTKLQGLTASLTRRLTAVPAVVVDC